MAAAAAPSAPSDPHIPVLLEPLLAAVAPVSGRWLDGTFGAGGYARGLLDAGATEVIGIDRDPSVFRLAAAWSGGYSPRLTLVEGTFSDLDAHAGGMLDGIVFDLGVSSMQIDQPGRGFSFQKDGPLDMRMGDTGPTAADLVNTASEGEIADILYNYGEERASRRIARAIVAARAAEPFATTLQLAHLIERCLPRVKPGQSHAATRSFQALRIAVNDEFGQLAAGLAAAERALKPGGWLAVVSFHSLEDRIVKRFFQLRSGTEAGGSRYAPEKARTTPAFSITAKQGISAGDAELARNPRSRSARLRIGRRTDAPAGTADPSALGLPMIQRKGH
jgi:16S rRNA (cytosine1402-N4)-methyltransferase